MAFPDWIYGWGDSGSSPSHATVRTSGGTSINTPSAVGDKRLLSTDYREDLIEGLPDCGVFLIQSYEDLFLDTYKDPGADDGLPITGGWGSTADWDKSSLELGDRRTEEEWTKLFFHQLKNDYWPRIVELIPAITEAHICIQGMMLSTIYNGGHDMIANTRGKYNNTSKALKSLDPERIAEALLWVNRGGNGKRMLGLFRRRYYEGQLALMRVPPLRIEIPKLKSILEAEADALWPKWLAKNGS